MPKYLTYWIRLHQLKSTPKFSHKLWTIYKYINMMTKGIIILTILTFSWINQTNCQGAYDPFQSYSGQKKGSLGPSEITAIVVGSFAGLCALGVTFFFCYYVYQTEERLEKGRYTPPGYRRP
ncbi:uncharacterized protein LOC107367813 isoform X2 [Tetranychus urticae]|uniref:uncharacterized protein LOC107367813 isoform X2 n=1 Tax=Tetranychus urticae TaxID=32264 RepID=UPI00077BCC0E|nr:uncharacterized protein LOC107367813 isoform X2 [Tetranychus urticae]